MNSKLEKLKAEMKTYLGGVTRENFSRSYKGATDIITSYRGKDLLKSEVEACLMELDREWEMDEFQEEVFLNPMDCLTGWCSPKNRIEWY